MATATSRATPPPRRTSTNSSPATSSIARGATARSAVSPKVNASLNGASRRPSVRGASANARTISGEIENSSRDVLVAALKQETEEKEQLLVRVQQKEQTISNVTSENDNLGAALHTAESRLAELYADQERMEDDMAARLELVDRLRVQVQELEKEKRDVLRRYHEQTATFDAERQSFYDNEQHLKSRIQSLIQAQKAQPMLQSPINDDDGDDTLPESEDQDEEQGKHEETQPHSVPSGAVDEDNEPAEMTSLRLELSTLSTSYSSLQNTVQLLSTQLLDLKRVNNQLQEENESYNILLREKTLNGQFDILKTVGTESSDEDISDSESDGDGGHDVFDHSSLRSTEKSTLEPVNEIAEDMDPDLVGLDHSQLPPDSDSLSSTPDHERSRRHGRSRRAATSSPHSQRPAPRGETLADLPITGPGLDLAAELGRAENLAILEGRADPVDAQDRSVLNDKSKRSKKISIDRKVSDGIGHKPEQSPIGGEVDALRNEVKSLKDANKALSLYASKIIDRIIAQEGFEHVLAVDYNDKSSNSGSPIKSKTPIKEAHVADNSPKKKQRPQSAIYAHSNISPEASDVSTTDQSIPAESTSTMKTQRRSLSFDWRSFSVFGSGEKRPDASTSLRPLTLRPGTASVVGARKLETHEDENDRKERERMNATLKLMGIEKPVALGPPFPLVKSYSSPDGTPAPAIDSESPRPYVSRFSFFRSKSSTSEASSLHSNNSGGNGNDGSNSNLTQEALERAEAETSLASLDAKEKVLSAEIAKGSSGGFTELPSRRHTGEERRSKRSMRSGGSGSTVWSAGMSTHREGDSEDD